MVCETSARAETSEVGSGEVGARGEEGEGWGVWAHARPMTTVSEVVWMGVDEGSWRRACDSWRCVVVRCEAAVWGMVGNSVI
jgi:hypothetical protein